ncbi:Sec-independent protein translocase TatC [Leptolinea tardivitalis]|nr:Sec-independent protein translocase TatC [Leptolinea tardivitalis]
MHFSSHTRWKNLDDNSLLAGLAPHFQELRRRLLVALIALVVCVLASFVFADRIINFLVEPIGGLQKLQSIEVTENISVFMKVALLSGFILALPIIAYEIVAFIVPGLEPREKRWLFISLPFIVILFVAGVAFTYFVMLKAAIPFLVNFLGVQTVPRLSNYVGFVTNLMFWIGLSFESPLVVLLLAKLKLVNARMLLKGWRVAIIVSAVLAAIITPTTDPVNMGLLMVPLMGLYLISIFLAYLVR